MNRKRKIYSQLSFDTSFSQISCFLKQTKDNFGPLTNSKQRSYSHKLLILQIDEKEVYNDGYQTQPYEDVVETEINDPLAITKYRLKYDLRTTLMIKNIPNKYTVKMILDEIDYYFKGKYDLFHLPQDIKNKCNVGYAFINFIAKQYVGQFYKQYNNKKWAKFNSQKICSLRYARVQGRNSLIHHFHQFNPLFFYKAFCTVDFSETVDSIIQRQRALINQDDK